MPVAVYGATGSTGRLVVSELVGAGEECVIGGRDPARLTELAEGHQGNVQARPARLEDPSSLEGLLKGCEVVVNCAPSAVAGEPLIRAAMEAGAHYVDAAGEQPFIRMVFERYADAAEDRGVALVPAIGFDYALGDCLARLAADGHEPLRELVIAYALSGSGVSRDAIGSSSEQPDGGEVVYRDGSWAPPPRGIQRIYFSFPPPLGRQAMQRYGSGEVITVPRHTSTAAVTTLITASTWSPHPALTPLMPWIRPVAATVRRTPLRRVLELAAPPADSSEDREQDRRTARFAIAAVAYGEDGSTGCGLVEGEDFYGLTAVTLARAATELASSSGRVGVLPSARAVDPKTLLDSLADRALRWRVE